MAITEHYWLDPKGTQIVKKLILNIIANNIIKNSITETLDENSDNKHRLAANILALILDSMNQKIEQINSHALSIENQFNEFNVNPIIFFEGKPEEVITDPSDDFMYVQLNDNSEENDLIWLYQKVKHITIEDVFTLTDDGYLILNTDEENLDISFEINEEGDLILTTSYQNNYYNDINVDINADNELLISTNNDDLSFNIEDGNLIIESDNENISFEMNDNGELLINMENLDSMFALIGGNLYFTYDPISPKFNVGEDNYEWICIGKRKFNINNYWTKDQVDEIKAALYEGSTEYTFDYIEEGYIQNKVNNAFND